MIPTPLTNKRKKRKITENIQNKDTERTGRPNWGRE
jgi:hypothetical protein